MTAATALASIAILIAALSALYARWAWSEARKANNISLHAYRKEIYDAFHALRMHMTQNADFADFSEVKQFYQSSRTAKLYFDAQLASEIERYYDLCFNITHAGRSQVSRDELITQVTEASRVATVLNSKLIKMITVK
ncbi:hypothetical protein [Aeromonas media]|uniref:hypothetical protein n=1 Tax=Aeromonas media TaxID=651 RepID=UPI0013A6CD83|nr:hypothetical protein [Aeromonas media]